MASSSHLQVQTLAQNLEVEVGDAPVTFEEAAHHVESLKLVSCEQPFCTDKPLGSLHLKHLPLNIVGPQLKLKYAFDVAVQVGGVINKERIKTLMRAGLYHELPEAIRPLGDHRQWPKFTMQLTIPTYC